MASAIDDAHASLGQAGAEGACNCFVVFRNIVRRAAINADRGYGQGKLFLKISDSSIMYAKRLKPFKDVVQSAG